jgi:hypothetical protein
MSKKLIAVASAAALALTALVGVAPASADVGATFNLNAASGAADTAFTPSATASAANAGAGDLVVPANNYLIYTNTADRSTLVKVIVSTSVGDLVTASSTGAMKILDLTGVGAIGADYKAETTANVDYKSDAGAQSLSRTATTDNVTFYVFTTSTSAASLTINKGGNTRVVWMKGKEGAAYNISAALPNPVPISEPDDHNVIVKITDVFGNTVKAATTVASSMTGAGVTIDAGTTAANLSLTYDATEGGHGFKLHTTGTGGLAVGLSITATDVTGLATAKKSLFLTATAVSVTGLTAQVTALTAQVAALTADYNALATRWNKKVASKRTVKKTVALK